MYIFTHDANGRQVLYTFLNRNKEATVITDDMLRIQYANKSAERLFDIKVVCIASFRSAHHIAKMFNDF